MTRWIAAAAVALAGLACRASHAPTTEPAPGADRSAGSAGVGTDPGHAGYGTPLKASGPDKLAAFAAGCFWGVEDAYRRVPGVVATAVGYAGGHTSDPTYEKVCTHTTGHAETVLVEYDPSRVPYEHLLRVFWKIHDPTQVGGQGPDEGDNYRSIIFTFDADQAAAARASEQAEQRSLSAPIVTEIRPMPPFYEAEAYHQQYAERTGHHGCPVRLPADTL
ncbi:MAG TPA: peptide-methionine (S)-S-oxide reductase MsrA [Polyangiaceae bacterium]|nr:peptide-methionine (S)-S-oxide reductase MsrA [Polyangiaceae bacterium]